jgi:ankyrin repeat domain-containing protein 50
MSTITCTPSIDESAFRNDDYTVGWICTLEDELAASQAMLDEEHPDVLQAENDTNTYTLGRIGKHNVVLACLPSGTTGISAAATTARDLLRSYPKVRFGLMVGVGGGAPSNPSDDPRQDIHLGDVIVSNPEGNYGKGRVYLFDKEKFKLTKCTGGVLQYDFGKTMRDGKFIQTGSLNKPPAVLLTGVSKLRALHRRKGSAIREHVNNMLELNPAMRRDFSYQSPEDDQLFQAEYDHVDSDKDCKGCAQERLIQRKSRAANIPVIHYGLIGSANRVMRHGVTREKLRQERGIICFEMEAAGLMDNFPCLVIRGICDYSDTHKNKTWQPYAAATAAAYAKELLGVISPVQVDNTPTAMKVSLLNFPA